jgi:hypothetical protein
MIRTWYLVLLALIACTSSRQIELSIDTTAGVPCGIDRVRVTAAATTFERSLEGVELPLAITLLDGTPDGSFDLEVSGLRGDTEIMRVSGSMAFRDHEVGNTVVLDPACTPTAPCKLADVMSPGRAKPVGSGFCRYAGSAGLESSESACGVPEQVAIHPETGPVRLTELEAMLASSHFQFYGRPIRQIWVAIDGYLSFAEGNPDPGGILTPGPLDRNITGMGSPPPQQSIFGFWDVLNRGRVDSQVCYAVQGAADQRRLLVTWAHLCVAQPCPTDDLNFTIAIEESSHKIWLTYGKMVAGNPDRALGINATVGLVDDATGCPADECALETGLCKDRRTPCGYSQVFSNTVQSPTVPKMHFAPILNSH